MKVIIKIAKQLSEKSRSKISETIERRKTYSDYSEAIKRCSDNAYQEHELIEVVLKKTQRFKDDLEKNKILVWDTAAYSILSVINPLLDTKENSVKVLDFGGACGAHYFHVRNFLKKDIKIEWCVVETPRMVEYAKILETEELFFFDNVDAAIGKLGKVNLLHTSGTLQCVDNPRKYLDTLLNIDADWVLFNRLGLSQGDKDFTVIHSSKLSWNGIGELPEGYEDKTIKYPFTYISEKYFYEKLKNKYGIFATFHEKSGVIKIKKESVLGLGLLCYKAENKKAVDKLGILYGNAYIPIFYDNLYGFMQYL